MLFYLQARLKIEKILTQGQEISTSFLKLSVQDKSPYKNGGSFFFHRYWRNWLIIIFLLFFFLLTFFVAIRKYKYKLIIIATIMHKSVGTKRKKCIKIYYRLYPHNYNQCLFSSKCYSKLFFFFTFLGKVFVFFGKSLFFGKIFLFFWKCYWVLGYNFKSYNAFWEHYKKC